jgi:hypothetical protein
LTADVPIAIWPDNSCGPIMKFTDVATSLPSRYTIVAWGVNATVSSKSSAQWNEQLMSKFLFYGVVPVIENIMRE